MNKQEAQHVKEAQQNIDIQEKEEAQEKQGIQDNTVTHETQEAQKPISQNAGATIETPLGPATLAADTLTDENKNIGKDALQDANAIAKEMDAVIYDSLVKYAKSESMEKITAIFPDARRWTLKEGKSGAVFVLAVLTAVTYYIDTLPDYLETIGGKDKKTLAHFATKVNPETGNTLLMDFLYFKEDATLDKDLLKPEALNIIAHKPVYFNYPCEKVSDEIFNAPATQPGEVLELFINTNPKDKKHTPYFYYSIDFDKVASDIPFVRRLTPFDERLLVGYGALMDADNPYFTNYQLFRAMGYDRNPKPAETRAIDASLSKMNIEVKINNKAEVDAGYKYDYYSYNKLFLPHERVNGVRINGKMIDSVIHPLKYPFLLELVAGRNGLQRIPMAVLQCGDINRSERILAIEDYLIRRISDVIRGYSKQNKILYDTMYRRFNLDSRKQKPRQRMREYAQRFLQHCKDVNWIKGYEIEKDCLIFYI